jgi:hypothetical protein
MRLLSFLAVVLLFSSCQSSKNEELILGKWKGAEWLVEGNPADYDPKEVHFTFSKDGYISDFGGEKEKGTYYIRGDELYTTPDDKMEIMVQIAQLSKDTLVFNMNRGGTAEKLTLVHE